MTSQAKPLLLVAALFSIELATGAMAIVKDGTPVAPIVIDEETMAIFEKMKATKNCIVPNANKVFYYTVVYAKHVTTDPDGQDRMREVVAALVLQEWVRRITDAELAIVGVPPKKGPALYIGRAAEEEGLKLDDIESPINEGLRVMCKGRKKALIGGQSGRTTIKAVCVFLEQLDCRYPVEDMRMGDWGASDFGKVFPRKKTLSVSKFEITRKPKLLASNIWGSGWPADSIWRVWNGNTGAGFSCAHAWAGYVKVAAKDHPDWWPEDQHGKREYKGGWVCTSPPELRNHFASEVCRVAQGLDKEGKRVSSPRKNLSISPPDNTYYCWCKKCSAQDDPSIVEPSSGIVSRSTRFLKLYNEIGAAVKKVNSDCILNFYCYSDYSQPPNPKMVGKVPDNLAAWPAPIRFCRWHRIGNPDCPSRYKFRDAIEGWSQIVPHLGYREFNFNLPDMLVPFSKIHVWRHDLPYLYAKGLMALDIETWIGPGINGPHIFLSTQLGYDPELDVDALMDDYFMHYYGPKAGPVMKEYWMNVDSVYENLTATHTGCYFSIPHVYTNEFRGKQRALVNKALNAAADDEMVAARLQLDADALTNADQFMAIIDALYRTMDFAAAETITEELDRRNKDYRAQAKVHKYTSKFIRRFFGRNVAYVTRNVTQDGGKLVYMLPDEWKLQWDDENQGVEKGYWKKRSNDADWSVVKTYSKTLRDQGQPERLTWMWYRTTFEVPKKHRRLRLAFMEIDGATQYYVNGKKVLMEDLDFPYWEPDTKRAKEAGTKEVWSRSRKPTLVDVTDHVKPGKNDVAVHVDHTHITEIFLGGIVRPVYLFDVPGKLHEEEPEDKK